MDRTKNDNIVPDLVKQNAVKEKYNFLKYFHYDVFLVFDSLYISEFQDYPDKMFCLHTFKK